jgi:type III restriction enzyme
LNSKEFLTRDVKIKPLTLFIDNIDEYRNKDGYIKKTVEQLAKAEIENLLKVDKTFIIKRFLKNH